RIARESELLHDAPADQVFLDDALDHLRRSRMVPDSFGINHRDRAAFANAETIGFGPVHSVTQSQLRETALEILPGIQAVILGATLGLGLIGAQKNVAANAGDSETGSDLG